MSTENLLRAVCPDMSTEKLLRAVRHVHLLIPRPGQEPKSWSMLLDGLHHSHIKSSAKKLRDNRKSPNQPVSDDPSLKVSGLHHGLAQALGSKSFDAWRNTEQELIEFLQSRGMTRPANLISWSRMFNHSLTARQVSDRLFNSGLPIPEKIFTGIGSKFFAAKGYGLRDLYELAEADVPRCHKGAVLEWCEERANQVVLVLSKRESDWDADAPDLLELTGRDLFLHSYRFQLTTAFNLLGDNLVSPMQRPPEFRLYNASEDGLAFVRRVFDIFRHEIDHSESGWVEVIPFPENNNVVFLKGAEGAFDWVVRDQRDDAFSSNPFYPFLTKDELPTAMTTNQLKTRHYFSLKVWQEKLEHSAEKRHYEEGGTGGYNWPGYDKLVERELLASHHVVPPRQLSGQASDRFISHRIDNYQLMVSPLVTINEFNAFLSGTNWDRTRLERAKEAKIELERDLVSLNKGDSGDLPASVTWLDAIAYCGDFEKRFGLPVRLLKQEEWQQIVPPLSGEIPDDPIQQLTWATFGSGGESSLCYKPDGIMSFGPNLRWTSNSEGLRFLAEAGFLEWLSGYQGGDVRFALAEYARAERGTLVMKDPPYITMRHHGLKVGFRLCYVAHSDA